MLSLLYSHLGFSWYLVDRWGRRFILLSGAVVVRTVIMTWFWIFLINVYRWALLWASRDGGCTWTFRQLPEQLLLA
jgi:hypothetical protein